MRQKLLVLLFLTIFMVSTLATVFDDFVYYVDLQTMYESDDQYLKILGGFLKRWETGLPMYVDNLQLSNLVLFPDDEITLKILKESDPYVYLEPAKLFEEALKEYPNSIIINSMYLFFKFQYWQNSLDPSAVKEIFEYSEKIEKLVGEKTPFTVYCEAQILSKSKIYNDPQKAYNDLKEIYLTYNYDKKIIESLVEVSFLTNNYEIIKDLYNTYINLKGNDSQTLLYFSKIFYNMGETEKSKEIALSLIPVAKVPSILSETYEFLGDIENNYEKRIEYYQKALTHDKENGRIMSKLGLTYYNWDKKEYAQLARYFLNAAQSRNYITEEMEDALKELRSRVVFEIFLKYLLPLLLGVVFALWLLYYLDKKRKIKEHNRMFKEQNNK
ncbi:MAG: hypothetical protein SVO01_13020 [Thermotogota bacterium]|nr:hypothetical protein [Thermotogota bacterium]